MGYIFNFNFIVMQLKQTNVERFYEWMLSINNKYLYDNDQMCLAFNIVALNDIEVADYEIIKPN